MREVWYWTGPHWPFSTHTYYILNHVHVPPVNWFNRNFIRKDELFFFIIYNIVCLFGLGVPLFDSSTLHRSTIFGLFLKLDSRSLWECGGAFSVSCTLRIIYVIAKKVGNGTWIGSRRDLDWDNMYAMVFGEKGISYARPRYLTIPLRHFLYI